MTKKTNYKFSKSFQYMMSGWRPPTSTGGAGRCGRLSSPGRSLSASICISIKLYSSVFIAGDLTQPATFPSSKVASQ